MFKPLQPVQEVETESSGNDVKWAARIEDIRHRIQIESRVIVGAKNMVRTLNSAGGKGGEKEQMKRTIAEVNFLKLTLLF